MLTRYKKLENGKLHKAAAVYQVREHGIDPDLLDQDAVRIIGRLQKNGFDAYIVGGAVRDLILGKTPKDFDIATSAEPNQIKRLFRNSRIIGKRFRLVHVFFHDGKIIETSTFRSADAEGFNNVYGTIDEDAWRRDFTINGLYYDPYEQTILDFVGGFRDIKALRLKPIIPKQRIFVEDPVRMIRAVKYSVSTGCRIGWFLARRIRSGAHLLADVSPSRISEEAFKILQGGKARPLIEAMESYGLLPHIFPGLVELFTERPPAYRQALMKSLDTLDQAVRHHGEHRRFIQLAYLVGDYVHGYSPWAIKKRLPFSEVYHDIKEILKPVTPPNLEVERCLIYLSRMRELYKDLGHMPELDHELTREVEQKSSQLDDRRRRPGREGPRPDAARPRAEQTADTHEGSPQPEDSGEAKPAARKRRPRNRNRRKPGSAGAAPAAAE